MSEKNSEKEQVYKGVFRAVKKDGTVYYRASLTRHGKHISLGAATLWQRMPIGLTKKDFVCFQTFLPLLNPTSLAPLFLLRSGSAFLISGTTGSTLGIPSIWDNGCFTIICLPIMY